MRTILHLLLIVLLVAPCALAQQAGVNPRGIIFTVFTSIDENELSQDLRAAIHQLLGQPFDQQTADAIAARIQNEKPEYVATVRLFAAPDPDKVSVVFVLEKLSDLANNVNSRYIVERVEIQGYDESKLPQTIRDQIVKLIGEKLDQNLSDQIMPEINDAVRPGFYVANKRVEKGNDPQHVVVIYDVKSIPWIPFVDQPSHRFLYHSKQNFSTAGGGDFNPGNAKGNPRLYFGLADDQDLLLERFAGFNFGLEARNVGSERFGFALRYARYHDRWQPSTVAGDPDAIYRERFNFESTMTFAFDPRARVTVGVSLSHLQMQYPEIQNVNANAAVGSFTFQSTWGRTGAGTHAFLGNYDFRGGTHNLESEVIYSRHAVRTEYVYTHRQKQQLLARFGAGEITGNAPLFERFSLGDTRTLRGWNKFDVAPIGGNRMMNATLEYNFSLWQPQGKGQFNLRKALTPAGFRLFYDAGVVGDRGAPMKARHSAGFGFGDSEGFMYFGFPIRSNDFSPIFMLGTNF